MWSCGGAGAVGRPRGSPGPDGEVWPDKQRTDYSKQAPISPYLDSARWVIGIGRDFYTKTPYSSDDDTYKSSSAKGPYTRSIFSQAVYRLGECLSSACRAPTPGFPPSGPTPLAPSFLTQAILLTRDQLF